MSDRCPHDLPLGYCNQCSATSQLPTPQKSLPDLIDEIEREAKTRLTEIEKIAFLNSRVPALVKALRRAIKGLDNLGAVNSLADVAQLLREPAEEKKELKQNTNQ